MSSIRRETASASEPLFIFIAGETETQLRSPAEVTEHQTKATA
jgi:hypothetical protein